MVALLIQYAALVCGYSPIIDYVKRTKEEQNRLFRKGLSKCDGYKKISDHQYGKGIDLYLEKGGKLIWDRKVYRILHKYWEFLGGKKMISWDIAHFGV